MPNLGVVSVRGVNMSVQDLHELDCSPTQTPAQTRSVSPTRGSNMPHTHREAAAFISRLNDMVTTEEASHGPGTGERVEAESEKDKALPTGQSLIAATTNSDKNSLTNGIDAKKAATESSFSSPVPTRLDGLVKVNAIDGSGSVSFRSKIQILLIYFLFNLGLTLYNKAVMIMVSICLNITLTVSC